MFFNIRERAQMYELLRRWPEEYQIWPIFEWQPRKNSVEVTIYFMLDGKAMRSDQEINLEHFDREPQEWVESDIEDFMEAVWIMFNANLADWEVKDDNDNI